MMEARITVSPSKSWVANILLILSEEKICELGFIVGKIEKAKTGGEKWLEIRQKWLEFIILQ